MELPWIIVIVLLIALAILLAMWLVQRKPRGDTAADGNLTGDSMDGVTGGMEPSYDSFDTFETGLIRMGGVFALGDVDQLDHTANRTTGGGCTADRTTGGAQHTTVNITSTLDPIGKIEYVDEVTGERQVYNTRAHKYAAPSTDRQVQQLAKSGPAEYARLIRLVARFYKGPIYEITRQFRQSDTQLARSFGKRDQDPVGTERRANSIATTIVRSIKERTTSNTKFKRGLDIGCNKGDITVQVARMLGIDEMHGVDVIDSSNPAIKYHKIASEGVAKLPYEDDSFDIITAVMTLHHVHDVTGMLAEIRRVLKPGGLLYIKEHDCWDSSDAMLVDLEHLFYHMVGEDEGDYLVRHYKNYIGWDTEVSLPYVVGDYFYSSVKHDITPTRAFWTLYQKSGGDAAITAVA